MNNMVYLDYASHTPVDERALTEFCRIERTFCANPLAAHALGQAAHDEMHRTTIGISEFLGVKPAEIIYTSGGSEANNLAIKGIAKAYKHIGKHILSTCLEHPSVSGTLAALQQEGYEIELLKILPNGQIDLSGLKTAIRQDTVLLCISAVDSELGAIQPINAIAEILASHPHCKLHIDAAQAIGKIPLCMNGFSTLSFSAHKFHGLCGLGVLVKREDIVLEPLIHGGASTTIYRSGTPTPGLASACFFALTIAIITQETNLEKVRHMQKYVIEKLKTYPLVRINSPADNSPYILNLSVTGVKAAVFQSALDKNGVAVSIKSACSTDNAPSRPVMAVSTDKKNALSSWRMSFSHLTTFQELDAFLAAFDICYKGTT